MQGNELVTATWDWRLIVLSYVVAALASYTALDLADRVIKTSRAASRRAWLAAGAFVMGTGIWSMHFTGMLAFQLSMPMGYDVELTVLSALVAVAASAVALFAVSRATLGAGRLLAGGTIMGVGIVSMHYIGMSAMRMPADIRYYPPLVALSVAIAVGASLAALRLASRFSREGGEGSLWLKGVSGLLMGVAIAGMHYTGIAAARFNADDGTAVGAATVDNVALGGVVGGFTLMVLGVALVCSMVDRRFAAQAADLAETERLYTSLFEQSVDALLVHDRDGNMVDCNSEACRSLGYTREELLSMRVADFVTNLATEEEKATEGETLWQRAMNTEPGQVAGVHEGEHVRKDGTSFPVEVRVGSVDYGGERMMFAAASDVTERKAAEEARRESEERHRAVVDMAPDAIVTMSASGDIRSFNAGAERIFGYTAEEAVGQPLAMLMPERFREHHVQGLARYLRTGEARVIGGTVELAGLDKDGEEFPVELSLAETLGDDARMFVGIIRDITERKKTEEAAAEQSRQSALRADVGDSLNLGGSTREILQRCTDAMVERVEEVSFARIWTLDEGEDELVLEARSGGGPEPPTLKKSSSVIVQEIDRTREPFAVDDMNADTRILTRVWARSAGMNAIVGYPLVVEGNLVGLVTTLSSAPLPEHAIEAVETMLDPISQGIRRKWAEERLRQSEERFRTFFEQSAVGVSIATPDRRLLETNLAYQKMVGYDEEELVGKPIAELSHPDDVPVDEGLNRRIMAGELDRYGVEKRYVRKDGTVIWVRPSISAVRGEGGEVAFLIGMVEDITERKRVEEELRDSEERFRSAFEDAAIGMALTRAEDLRYLRVNRALCDMLGYSEEELLTLSAHELTHPEDREDTLNYARRAREGGTESYEYEKRYLHADGHTVWASTGISLVRDAEDRPLYFVAQMQDVTGRKKLEEELQHRAFHDPLTGLPNRTLFMECLERALPRAARGGKALATLFLDLDNFKFINDSLSHDVGDQLLVQVADRLRACLRQTDTAARFGGDEFTILVEEIASETGAVLVAERISEALQESFSIGEREIFVTFSIGIAVSLDGGEEPPDLLRDADTAMYRAKNGGKDRYEIFDESMNTRALQRLELEADLHRAMERDEITVHYQPVFSLETGSIVGMEALMRWAHPERGLVSPAEFIPLAEETGIIIPLGRLILEVACRQAREWQGKHLGEPHPIMGVNLSLRQLQDPGLTEEVAGILRETGLDPAYLALEITETVAMHDADSTVATLEKLKALGVWLVIDDFGSGNSSLSYLTSRFKMDHLKIDGSFVREFTEDTEDSLVLPGLIDFAHAVGLRVIAEGVETPDQFQRLREMGCEFVQGYYIANPLTAAAATELLSGCFPSAEQDRSR